MELKATYREFVLDVVANYLLLRFYVNAPYERLIKITKKFVKFQQFLLYFSSLGTCLWLLHFDLFFDFVSDF